MLKHTQYVYWDFLLFFWIQCLCLSLHFPIAFCFFLDIFVSKMFTLNIDFVCHIQWNMNNFLFKCEMKHFFQFLNLLWICIFTYKFSSYHASDYLPFPLYFPSFVYYSYAKRCHYKQMIFVLQMVVIFPLQQNIFLLNLFRQIGFSMRRFKGYCIIKNRTEVSFSDFYD